MYSNYDREKFQTLTAKEQNYFLKMAPQSGVLFITSKPGLAKSSIARSIANKMGMQYMDIRLSMVDETDVGLFPMFVRRCRDHWGAVRCPLYRGVRLIGVV